MVTVAETRFGEVLALVGEAGRAVGAFTCYDLLGFEAVVRAAESRRAPVIVLMSLSSFGAEGGERLARAFGAAAKGSSVEVLVQLDHAREERLIRRAAGCGVDAVMADGSKLTFAENLAFTRAVAGSMRPRGVGLEAELGRVNTELRAAYFGHLEDELSRKVTALDLKGLGDGLVEAVQEVVEAKLCAFGWIAKEA